MVQTVNVYEMPEGVELRLVGKCWFDYTPDILPETVRQSSRAQSEWESGSDNGRK